MGTKKIQTSGNDSINIQAENVHYNGLTESQVREISREVIHQELNRFARKAKRDAEMRFSAFTDGFLEAVHRFNPEGIRSFQSVDFQYVWSRALLCYIRRSEPDLQQVLYNLLLEKIRKERSSILDIVINEAIDTAARVTTKQLSILSLVLFIRHTYHEGIVSRRGFHEFIRSTICPLIGELPDSHSAYEHLVYAGCVGYGTFGPELHEYFENEFPGFVTWGFRAKEIGDEILEKLMAKGIAERSYHDPAFFELRARDFATLKKIANEADDPDILYDELERVMLLRRFDKWETERYLVSIDPRIKALIERWSRTSLRAMTLTTVGIVLAHANLRRYSQVPDVTAWLK